MKAKSALALSRGAFFSWAHFRSERPITEETTEFLILKPFQTGMHALKSDEINAFDAHGGHQNAVQPHSKLTMPKDQVTFPCAISFLAAVNTSPQACLGISWNCTRHSNASCTMEDVRAYSKGNACLNRLLRGENDEYRNEHPLWAPQVMEKNSAQKKVHPERQTFERGRFDAGFQRLRARNFRIGTSLVLAAKH